MNKNSKMKHSKRSRIEMKQQWPNEPFHIVLINPEIPPNTGNIARLCAATGATLHLIEPLGFQINDKQIRRAGLDYWDAVNIQRHPNLEAFFEKNKRGNKYFFSTSGQTAYTQVSFQPGDFFIFGCESRGLPDELIAKNKENTLNIPIRLDHVRSLNLSNSASIILYEALRQLN